MLPLLRSRPSLLTALAVDAVGNGCAGPLMLLYFTRSAGLRLVTVGAILSAANLAVLVMPAVIGAIVGRVGPLRVVVAGQVLQGLAFLGFLFVRTPWQLGITALVGAIGLRAFWSTIFGLVDAAAGDDRVFAEVGAVQAGGLGLGALLAGLLISAPGSKPLVIVVALDAASFAVSAILLARQRIVVAPPSGPPPLRTALRDRRYVSLVVANTLFACCSLLFSTGVPVLLYVHLHSQHWVIGAILAGATAAIAFGQTWGVRRFRHLSTASVLAMAALVWCGWALATGAASEWPGTVGVLVVALAAVPFAFAELLHAPASTTLAASYAEPASRGAYLALFQYSFAIASVVVPFTFTSLSAESAALPWLAAAGAAVVAGGIMLGLARGASTPAHSAVQ